MAQQRFELFIKKLSDEQLDDLLASVMNELRARDANLIKEDIVSKSQTLRLQADETTKSNNDSQQT